MKFMDPTIETVALRKLQSYDANLGSWEYTVLDECYDEWITFLYTSTTEIMQMILSIPGKLQGHG